MSKRQKLTVTNYFDSLPQGLKEYILEINRKECYKACFSEITRIMLYNCPEVNYSERCIKRNDLCVTTLCMIPDSEHLLSMLRIRFFKDNEDNKEFGALLEQPDGKFKIRNNLGNFDED